jgi:hypothetical protein
MLLSFQRQRLLLLLLLLLLPLLLLLCCALEPQPTTASVPLKTKPSFSTVRGFFARKLCCRKFTTGEYVDP